MRLIMNIKSAFSAFFAILFNKDKAVLWQKSTVTSVPDDTAKKLEVELSNNKQKVIELQLKVAELEKAQSQKSEGDEAVYTLALLQREGRLIDFLKENIDQFDDTQVGAAVRQVHQGCGKVLDKHFFIVPVIDAADGENVTIEADFDSTLYELSGNANGKPPFKGELRHKGWKSSKVDLPVRQKSKNNSLICAAEIEVP